MKSLDKKTSFIVFFFVLGTLVVLNLTVKKMGSGRADSDTKIDTDVAFGDLVEYTKGKNGTYSVYIKDLNSQEELYFNESRDFYSASLFKLPVAMAILKDVEKGRLKLDTELVYLQMDNTDGTGAIYKLPVGSKLSVDEVLNYLLKESDNIAQNILLRYVSFESLDAAFKLASDTYLSANITKSKDYSSLLEKLYAGQFLNEENMDYLLNIMKNTSFDDRVSVFLNENLAFSHKIGSWPGMFHDCGIIVGENKAYTLCIMSEKTSLEDFKDVGKKTAEFVNNL